MDPKPVSASNVSIINEEYSAESTLDIPSIGVKGVIGRSEKDELWFAKDIDPKGNVVIAGHRFRYINPLSTAFYFLNEIEIEDEIVLKHSGLEYTYEVINTFEVKADEVWIERDYTFPSITLYTCTPIYNPQKRLVVVGKLVSIK